MYDELVKRLKESKNEQCYIGCFGNCGDCKIDAELEQAADAIEELQAAEKKYLANISALEAENQHLKRERDWIPVTENLPDRAGSYLCTVYGDSILENYVTICSYSCRPLHTVTGWFCPCGPRYLENVTNEVVAWMPLPEPYEPPKEE